MLRKWNMGTDRAKRGPQRKGGLGAHPGNLKKTRLQMESYSGALIVNKISVYFFRIRSNSSFSGAVGSYEPWVAVIVHTN